MRERSNVLLGIAAVWLAVICASASAEEACKLMQYASLALGTDETGGVYIPALINGHKENLLVDTGGFVSMLAPGVVDALSLHRDCWTAAHGLPCTEAPRFASPRRLR